VTELNFRSTPDVWGYFSVDSSGRVHEFADSQIGHLFSWGLTREDARQHMVLALKELSIRGDIRTTVEYLVGLLESRDFRGNRINTAWLDGRIQRNIRARKPDSLLVAMVGAVWRGHTAYERRRREFVDFVDRGQQPPPHLVSVHDTVELIYDSRKYTLTLARSGANAMTLTCNDSATGVEFRPLSDGGLLVLLCGRSHVAYGKEEAAGLRLTLDGATCQFTNEYDPTQLRAAMSGKLARYCVEDGTHVLAGSAYAEVEVMKMYMPLTLPESGVITLLKPEGSVLEPGDLLARVALDDPSKVHKAEPFTGTLPAGGDATDPAGVMTLTSPPAGVATIVAAAAATAAASPAVAHAEAGGSSSSSGGGGVGGGGLAMVKKWHTVARAARRQLDNVLAGFSVPAHVLDTAWQDWDIAHVSPDLPVCELEDVLSILNSRLPPVVVSRLKEVVAAHKTARAAALAQLATSAAAAAGGVGGGDGTSSPVPVPAPPPPAGPPLPEFDFGAVGAALDEHVDRLRLAGAAHEREVAAFDTTAAPLRLLCLKYAHGVAGAARLALYDVLAAYLSVERRFGDGRRGDEVVADLRSAATAAPGGSEAMFDVLRAHTNLAQRNQVVLACLARVSEELELSKAAEPDALTHPRPRVLPSSSSDAGSGSPPLEGAAGLLPSSSPHGAHGHGGDGPGSNRDSPMQRRFSLTSTASSAPSTVSTGAGGGSAARAALGSRTASQSDAATPGALPPMPYAAMIADAEELALGICRPSGKPPSEGGHAAGGTMRAAEAAPAPGGDASASPAGAAAGAAGSRRRDVNPAAHIKAVLPLLHDLAELRGSAYADVTLEARQILIKHQQPSGRQRYAAVASLLRAIGPLELRQSSDADRVSVSDDALSALVDDAQPLLDVLSTFFAGPDAVERRNAAEVYIRRLYRMYAIRHLKVMDGGAGGDASCPLDCLAVAWTFCHSDFAPEMGTQTAGGGSGTAAASPGLRLASGGSSGTGAPLRRGSSRGSGGPVANVMGLPRSRLTALPVGDSVLDLAALAPPALTVGESTDVTFPARGHGTLAVRALSSPRQDGEISSYARSAALAPTVSTGGGGGGGGVIGSDSAVSLVGAGAGATPASDAGSEELDPAAAIYAPVPGDRQGIMVAFATLAHMHLRIGAAIAELAKQVAAAAEGRVASARSATPPRGSEEGATFGLPVHDEGEDDGDVASSGEESDGGGRGVAAAGGSTPSKRVAPPRAAEPRHVMHVLLLQSPLLDAGFAATTRGRGGSGHGGSGGASGVGWSRRTESGTGLTVDDDALERGVIDALVEALRPWHEELRRVGVKRLTVNVPNPKGAASGVAGDTPHRTQARSWLSAVVTDEALRTAAARAASAGVPAALVPALTPALLPIAAAVSRTAASTTLSFPWIYTFRHSTAYAEDPIVRHIEPPSSAYLELGRLSNFRVRPVPIPNRMVHVYAAEPREKAAGGAGGGGGGGGSGGGDSGGALSGPRLRYFVRSIVRQTARIPTLGSVYEQYPGPERMFVECLDALALAMGDALQDTAAPVGNNHIFLNVLPVASVRPEYIENVTKILARRYAERLRRLRVSQVEFRITVSASPGTPPLPLRLVSSNPTGYVLRVDSYVETRLGEGGGYTPRRTMPVFMAVTPSAAMPVAPSIMDLFASSGGSGGGGSGGGGMLGGLPSLLMPMPLTAMPSALPTSFAGELDGKPINSPYPIASPFDRQRALAAALSDTVYVYDFLELFSRALDHEWSRYLRTRGGNAPHRKPATCLQAVELVLRRRAEGGAAAGVSATAPAAAAAASAGTTGGEWELVEVARPPGRNDIGMVAWRLTLATPQFPEEAGGRQVVVIANDITHKAGSFGTAEDELFAQASAYARTRGLPRVYLAANSGARIGLSDAVKRVFRVAWTDEADPTKGFRYLYLTPGDYRALTAAAPAGKPAVAARRLVEAGEERWMLTDIIGSEPDLGVENLRGSGTIAGETSRAYGCSFTLTYVTGRSVGIGAYLVRLGHRTIQKAGSAPIILTGYEALNKLMGSEVYSSNLQLGGPRIMYWNGVSQAVVDNDYEGVCAILQWLSYVPAAHGGPLPVMDVLPEDDVERDVAFAIPASAPYDPRHALCGVATAVDSGAASPLPGGGGAALPSAAPMLLRAETTVMASEAGWVGGLLDRDSWCEAMAGWAKSVITGRGRIGGIPVGIVCPEVRSTTAVLPADPAAPTSKEALVAQAGQVWYPDSAFKTAQAIRDFTGEELPVVIIANWRGFSGGARDMFYEVLKYGSFIVDALVACRTPVLVYIPPGGELRGGAWVVVDPTINPDVMEIYSDPAGRGGVLEPSGTAAIKFRAREQMAAAARLDPVLRELQGALAAGATATTPPATPVAAIKSQIKRREAALASVYVQISHAFADLHDTPGRMLAVGAINGVVPWHRARSFFYWRLRRLLSEHALVARVRSVAAHLSFADARALLQQWFGERGIAHAGHTPVVAAPGSVVPGGMPTGPAAAGADAWRDDQAVLRWLSEHRDGIETRLHWLRREAAMARVVDMGMEDTAAVIAGVLALLPRLPADRREAAVAALRRGVLFGPTPLPLPGGGAGGAGGSSSGVPVPMGAAPPLPAAFHSFDGAAGWGGSRRW
jgi:acetyl-CoA carboxylase carboxyltransferase component/biotin carboxyl carrier protein